MRRWVAGLAAGRAVARAAKPRYAVYVSVLVRAVAKVRRIVCAV